MSGQYTINTGRRLADLPADLLHDVGYYALTQAASIYKEQAEGVEKMEGFLKDKVYEEETGLPAIAQFMPPADAAGGMPPM